MRITICTLYCLLSFCITPLIAQNYSGQILNNYNSENGLPQNSVRSTQIDKNGYLWAATEMGLVRFDGSRFTWYNQYNTPQLLNNRINRVSLNPDSTLYFRDEKNRIYFFDTQQQLQRIDKEPELLVNVWDYGVLDLQPLWKHPGNGELEKKMRPLMPSHTLFVATSDSTSGYLIFGAGHYFAYISRNAVKWIQVFNGSGIAKMGGDLYYSDSTKKFIRADSLGNKTSLTIWYDRGGIKTVMPADAFKMIAHDKRGLYVRYGEAIWRLEHTGDQTLWASPVLSLSGIPEPVSYLNAGKPGLQIIGSRTNGLFLVRNNPFTTLKPPAGISAVMYSQSPVKDSFVLTAAEILPAGRYSLKKMMYNDLFSFFAFRDKQQHHWIVKQDTLIELDPQLHRVRKIYPGGGPVQCMQQTSDGALWISVNDYSRHETRFGKISGDSVIWKHTNGQQNYNETFLALNDHCFLFGNKNGLQELDIEKGKITEFPLFANTDVRSLYKDQRGIIWIGTYGNGFYAKYHDRFVKLPLDRNGYLSTAHTFLEDKKGFLWVTTNKGLFQMKMADLDTYLRDSASRPYYHYYNKLDGLPTNEFNGGCNPSGIILDDGRFSLPSMDGLVQFDPGSITPLLPQNEISIDEVWVDSTRITEMAGCILPPSFGRITISVSSPYFGNPYNQNIEYNLKGMDDNWYPLNENNIIVFNRLTHGNYQLQLRKQAGFGIGNYVIRQFPITIQAGFTDTWTFKIILLALVGSFVYGLMKFRYRYLVRKKRLLEEEVKTRTAGQQQLIGELQTTVQELEISREELFYNNRFKEKLALLITHDLQSPLRFLSVMCDQLNEKAARNGNEEIRSSTNEIKNTGKEIHSFVEEIGLWATTQQENFRIHVTSFSLQPVTEELGKFFKEMIQSQGNQLLFDIEPSIKLITDRQLLKTILRNLIDNANKHTRGGTIRISLTTQHDKAAIAVSDNGKGMPLNELQKIRLRMEQSSRAAILDKDNRLGYQIIIDFVNRLGGRLYLQASPETGTSVTVGNIVCELQEVRSE